MAGKVYPTVMRQVIGSVLHVAKQVEGLNRF